MRKNPPNYYHKLYFYFALQLEKFRSHNAQWMNMVETQQQLDESAYYNGAALDDDDENLPDYLTSSYLDECMLYSADDPERNASAMSLNGQPVVNG